MFSLLFVECFSIYKPRRIVFARGIFVGLVEKFFRLPRRRILWMSLNLYISSTMLYSWMFPSLLRIFSIYDCSVQMWFPRINPFSTQFLNVQLGTTNLCWWSPAWEQNPAKMYPRGWCTGDWLPRWNQSDSSVFYSVIILVFQLREFNVFSVRINRSKRK